MIESVNCTRKEVNLMDMLLNAIKIVALIAAIVKGTDDLSL